MMTDFRQATVQKKILFGQNFSPIFGWLTIWNKPFIAFYFAPINFKLTFKLIWSLFWFSLLSSLSHSPTVLWSHFASFLVDSTLCSLLQSIFFFYFHFCLYSRCFFPLSVVKRRPSFLLLLFYVLHFLFNFVSPHWYIFPLYSTCTFTLSFISFITSFIPKNPCFLKGSFMQKHLCNKLFSQHFLLWAWTRKRFELRSREEKIVLSSNRSKKITDNNQLVSLLLRKFCNKVFSHQFVGI